MPRVQGELHVGRNNAALVNATWSDPAVRVTTPPSTRRSEGTPAPAPGPNRAVVLTPRTSARPQVMMNEVMMKERVVFVRMMKKRFPTKASRKNMLSCDEKVFGGEAPSFAFECRAGDVVPDHVAFMGVQAETERTETERSGPR